MRGPREEFEGVMIGPEKTRRLEQRAHEIGFELCGVAPTAEFVELRRMPEWLERGHAGEMKYLHDPRRSNAESVVEGARAMIVCALNYNAPAPPNRATWGNTANEEPAHEETIASATAPRGWISRYAWGEEYHVVVGRKLDELLAWMRAEFGGAFRAKAYVDTGPVAERIVAKYAGLGWQGKNTCLINQKIGSWLFLGVIMTDLDLAPSLADGAGLPHDRCGSCRRCIEACPTQAIVEPYVLDARRCIAYLTIELRGPIPEEFRAPIGNHVFGCDICQDVCPWNRKSPPTPLAEFFPRSIRAGDDGDDVAVGATNDGGAHSLYRPSLEWLISMDEAEFRSAFRGSPVKRAKWRGLIRNACVALGNSGIRLAAPENSKIRKKLEELAASEVALVAEHAQWALEKLRVN